MTEDSPKLARDKSLALQRVTEVATRLSRAGNAVKPVDSPHSPDLISLTHEYQEYRKNLHVLVEVTKNFYEQRLKLDQARTEVR
jgi:hypothetical protein